jgi:hypothetical protein
MMRSSASLFPLKRRNVSFPQTWSKPATVESLLLSLTLEQNVPIQFLNVTPCAGSFFLVDVLVSRNAIPENVFVSMFWSGTAPVEILFSWCLVGSFNRDSSLNVLGNAQCFSTAASTITERYAVRLKKKLCEEKERKRKPSEMELVPCVTKTKP